MVLQRLVAELELDQRRLSKRNSHLENQKDRLKRDRDALRDTLRQVRDQGSNLRPAAHIWSTTSFYLAHETFIDDHELLTRTILRKSLIQF